MYIFMIYVHPGGSVAGPRPPRCAEWGLPFGRQDTPRWALATVAYGRALTAGQGDAEAPFQESLEQHDRASRPLDAARTQLAYGEWLRRSQRRVDARQHLRDAVETFQDLRAATWPHEPTRSCVRRARPHASATRRPCSSSPQPSSRSPNWLLQVCPTRKSQPSAGFRRALWPSTFATSSPSPASPPAASWPSSTWISRQCTAPERG